jgi:FlaA1/EpsC-like NDP-sugar epimerase
MKFIFNVLISHFKAVRYRWLVLSHDLLVIPLAWMGAYWLRYNLGHIPDEFLARAAWFLIIIVPAQGATLLAFGVHRGVWRFTSLPDLTRVLKAVVVGIVITAVALFLYNRLQLIPRSIFFLYGLLLATILCGSRMAYRLLKDHHISTRIEKKALIVGAGAAGEQVVRDLKRNTPRIFDPVVFVDDAPSKRGKDIHGIRVAGSCADISRLCEQWSIDLILIAVPSASDGEMRRIVEFCEASNVEFRTLPTVHDVVAGKVGVQDLREVRIDDLLGREQVTLDWARIGESLRQKVALISGAGGSIGSELCRQVAAVEPRRLVLFEQSEYNLYAIEQELRQRFPELDLVIVLGDICDPVTVKMAFASYRPNIVFHAAAYKHVPLLESQVREVVKNNVIGSRTLADQAEKHHCETFVLISTDKAVNPTSFMGACKRVGEIYCQALDSQTETRFVTVRFGNVLGSAGSVVPLFNKQIREGGPVTVTHPDILRYFMTITEATQLILQASSVGQGGEIFVLDMGEPINIDYLATQMIKLSGKVPGDDVKIIYTGLRPGEKLNEELFYSDEHLSETPHNKLMLAHSREVGWRVVEPIMRSLEEAVEKYDEADLRRGVRQLVPEYTGGSDAEARNPQATVSTTIPTELNKAGQVV